METTVKVLAKAGTGKAFKADDDNWYNMAPAVMPYLAKVNKGDSINISYEKKGTSRIVTRIGHAGEPVVEKKAVATEGGFACEVCGKALKDGKYTKCFTCNQKAKTEAPASVAKKGWTSSVTDDRTAQIMRGNALNAAGAAIGGNLTGTDPNTIAEALIIVAERALEWLKAGE